MSQVDGHGVQPGGGLGAHFVQRPCLPVDDRGLIDLEDRGAGHPGQPVGAGVQTGGQDDHLAHARGARVGEVSSISRVRTAIIPVMRAMPKPAPSSTSSASRSPLARRVKKSTPTARTSGSANGSLISASGTRLTSASHSHAGSGGADAGCQIPSVVI